MPDLWLCRARFIEGDYRDRLVVQTEEYAVLREGPHVSRRSSRFLLRARIDAARDDFEAAFAHTLCAAWDADDWELKEVASALRKLAGRHLAGRSIASVDLRLTLLDVLRRTCDWAAATALARKMVAQMTISKP